VSAGKNEPNSPEKIDGPTRERSLKPGSLKNLILVGREKDAKK